MNIQLIIMADLIILLIFSFSNLHACEDTLHSDTDHIDSIVSSKACTFDFFYVTENSVL